MNGFFAIAWNPDFLLRPLAFYGLLAAGLGLCLYLFVTLKAEVRGVLRRFLDERKQLQALETALGETRLTVQALQSDLRTLEQQTGMLVVPPPARSGLNLSKRTQALRLHRAGQDTACIAAALALPRSEVDLLVKVHRIVLEQI